MAESTYTVQITFDFPKPFPTEEQAQKFADKVKAEITHKYPTVNIQSSIWE